MHTFFIMGTGTGVGKTLVATALCHQLRLRGKNVHAVKPVISGYDATDDASDTRLILEVLGREATEENTDAISPWRFAAPVSPHIAAKQEGKQIEVKAVIDFLQNQQADYLIVEGAGGIMSPLTDRATWLEVIEKAENPQVVLIGGSYLGSISHVLTAISALKTRSVPLRALVISESEKVVLPLDEMLATVSQFTNNIPILAIPRLEVSSKCYTQAPPLDAIFS